MCNIYICKVKVMNTIFRFIATILKSLPPPHNSTGPSITLWVYKWYYICTNDLYTFRVTNVFCFFSSFFWGPPGTRNGHIFETHAVHSKYFFCIIILKYRKKYFLYFKIQKKVLVFQIHAHLFLQLRHIVRATDKQYQSSRSSLLQLNISLDTERSVTSM